MPANTKPRLVDEDVPQGPQSSIRRMTFNVPDRVAALIQELAERENRSMTEIFTRAMGTYALLKQKDSEGKKLFLGRSPDAIETELYFLS